MIVSEETAKGMKCAQDPARVCQASRCMGWRWATAPRAPSDTEEAVEGVGYCGPAGDPREEAPTCSYRPEVYVVPSEGEAVA